MEFNLCLSLMIHCVCSLFMRPSVKIFFVACLTPNQLCSQWFSHKSLNHGHLAVIFFLFTTRAIGLIKQNHHPSIIIHLKALFTTVDAKSVAIFTWVKLCKSFVALDVRGCVMCLSVFAFRESVGTSTMSWGGSSCVCVCALARGRVCVDSSHPVGLW